MEAGLKRKMSWALLALSLGSAACSQPAPVSAQTSVSNPESAAFLKENDVAMERMMADMHVAPTGDVDKDFARMMIPHHQGAIDMAEALLKHGKNEELKTLARNIIATQTEEIALMRRIAGESPAPTTAAMPGMNHQHH